MNAFRKIFAYSGCLLFAMLAFGCGRDIARVSGRVVKNDQPLQLARGERLRVVFYHMNQGSDVPSEPYLANINKDGTFAVPGKTGKGIPVGTYRVGIQILRGSTGPHGKDLLEGKFSDPNKPILHEITSDQDFTFDVGKAPS